jgi:hypothetical protein
MTDSQASVKQPLMAHLLELRNRLVAGFYSGACGVRRSISL